VKFAFQDATIQFWLNNGCPASKLLLGIPTFGRSFTLENPNSPGLGANAIGAGLPGPFTQEAGFLGYYEVTNIKFLIIN